MSSERYDQNEDDETVGEMYARFPSGIHAEILEIADLTKLAARDASTFAAELIKQQNHDSQFIPKLLRRRYLAEYRARRSERSSWNSHKNQKLSSREANIAQLESRLTLWYSQLRGICQTLMRVQRDKSISRHLRMALDWFSLRYFEATGINSIHCELCPPDGGSNSLALALHLLVAGAPWNDGPRQWIDDLNSLKKIKGPLNVFLRPAWADVERAVDLILHAHIDHAVGSSQAIVTTEERGRDDTRPARHVPVDVSLIQEPEQLETPPEDAVPQAKPAIVREVRKKRSREKHQRWKAMRDSGQSYGQIADAERVTREAVIHALQRLNG
jgi:hypothetical protein